MTARRFMIFVASLFVVACILAAVYALVVHPGQTASETQANQTSQIEVAPPLSAAT